MSSNKERQSYQKKESINNKIRTNIVNLNNSKNQCLYKKEILSSLLKLPTKIKQDGIIKSYKIKNIERENKIYNSRPITVNLNKSFTQSNLISPYKKNNNNNNFNEKNNIEIVINNLNDLFNQIQISFFQKQNCLNDINNWIEMFYNNINIIIENFNANEYLPLINNSLNLLFFSIIIIYDICCQNKIDFYIEDIKIIFNNFILLSESIFERCKNNGINLQQQSNLISVSNKDLNSNLTQLIKYYNQINYNISKEIDNLFKRLRRINSSDIYDFYQTKIKLFEIKEKNKNNNLNNINNYSDNETYNLNYNSFYPRNKNNVLISHYNSNTINLFNNKRNNEEYNNKKYSTYTSNSTPNPSNNYSDIIKKGPGKFLTTEINFVGAALSNGVIFPFKKTSAMRLKEKNDRLRSISNNSNYSDNNLDYYNQSNNNYSNNTSPIYHSNFFNDNNYNNNNEIIEYENKNYYNVNHIKNNKSNIIRNIIDNNNYSKNNNYYYNNENIGKIDLNIPEPNINYNQRTINLNTPLIPFSPDKPYTLILDLEETLSYISKNTKKIYLRPYLREFLNSLLPYYELIIITNYYKDYADQIINFIENQRKYFDYRLYRQNSNYSNDKYNYKNIQKLGRDYKRTIIIDDKDENIELNNAIIIKSFIINENYNFNINDSVLYDLINILIKIAKEEPNDIRHCLRKYRNEINRQITK